MNDVPTAVTIPALLASLSLLGLVLKSFIEREMNTDKRKEKRIAKLEAQLEEMRANQSEERRQKHNERNRAGGLAMAVKLLMLSARRCTCGEMTSVVELVDQTGVMEEEHGHR